jgi:enolase
MDSRIDSVRFRGILESRGRPTVEAEVRLAGGGRGLGSAPVAIAPGRRERQRSHIRALGSLSESAGFFGLRAELEGAWFGSQASFDAALESSAEAEALGADVRLALSLAFCRARADGGSAPLFRALAELSGIGGMTPAMPRPLVNIFSGGIHDGSRRVPFQQMMIAPDCGDLAANLDVALAVFAAVEKRLRSAGRQYELSASSGLLVQGLPYTALLDELREEIGRLGLTAGQVPLGIDVAAEHLRGEDGRYRLSEDTEGDLTGGELLELLAKLIGDYGIGYLEDPFDPADESLWRTLTAAAPAACPVVGDDLFATSSRYVTPGLADGILLKLNQVGTVTGALEAARAGRAAGMILCVSHRSGETEDTAMCDFAAAVGASFIKVGGPRRGDRTAKYNQLLRLAEELGVAPSPSARAFRRNVPETVKESTP